MKDLIKDVPNKEQIVAYLENFITVKEQEFLLSLPLKSDFKPLKVNDYFILSFSRSSDLARYTISGCLPLDNQQEMGITYNRRFIGRVLKFEDWSNPENIYSFNFTGLIKYLDAEGIIKEHKASFILADAEYFDISKYKALQL